MIVTKTQLRKIIKEETNRVVKEWTIGGYGTGNKKLFAKLREYIRHIEDAARSTIENFKPQQAKKDYNLFVNGLERISREFRANEKTFKKYQRSLLASLVDSDSNLDTVLGILSGKLEQHGQDMASAEAEKERVRQEMYDEIAAQRKGKEDLRRAEKEAAQRKSSQKDDGGDWAYGKGAQNVARLEEKSK